MLWAVLLLSTAMLVSVGEKSALAQQADDSPAQSAQKTRLLRVKWDDSPSLRIGRILRLDLRARLQRERGRSDAPMDPDDADAAPARRIGVEGDVAGWVGFQIEREIGDDEPWRDVFVTYQQFETVQVQYGKFKVPFGLDETTSAARLDFVHRSRLADELSPGRDRGVMLLGQLFSRTIRYELGSFRHDGANARRQASDRVYGGRTLAGRLAARPLRAVDSPLADVHLAIAFTRSELPLGFSALHGQTVLGAEFYEPRVWVRGRRQRLGLEARWRPGPFSVKAEYVRVTDERRELSVEVTDLPPALAVGWYVSGTWALTGERKSDGLEHPKRPVWRGGPGALELAARTEALSFGSVGAHGLPSTSLRADVVLGNRLRVTTLGVNWHPMRWITLQINVLREAIDRPDQGPLPQRRAFWSRVLRFQLAM
jgi:phosphate-selective porin OprO/OprP